MSAGQTLDQVEDFADTVLRKTRGVIRPLAHVCLVSTFIEDGFRMITQWNDQTRYINATWRCGWFLATCFVLLNMLCQMVPVGMILAWKRVRIAVAVLVGIVLLQSIAYSILWDLHFFLRNLAVIGGLMLLLAETTESAKTMFAGLPSMEEANQTGNYLQLTGRIMVVFMFLTSLKFDGVLRILLEIVCVGLILCVMVGFKTKLAAFCLVILLTLQNVVFNSWWTLPAHSGMRDFVKYDFFQTLSVVGGLLLMVELGPGGLSMDERKKK